MLNRSITVLHLVHSLTVGGAERVLVNVVNNTCDKYRHIICSLTMIDIDFSKTINLDKVTITCLNKKQGNDFRLPLRIAQLCNKFSVDLIHAQGWGTYMEGVAGAKISRRKPAFVFAFRGKTIDDLAGVKYHRILAQRILAHFCSAILTPSWQMANEYAETIGINKKKIEIIYNGVDTAIYRPSDDSSAAKHLLRIPDNRIVFGCVARFDPVKNLHNLLIAFSCLAKVDENVALLLVGDGESKPGLERLIDELNLGDRVFMPGATTDVAAYYQAMDIYVQPSLYEGTSNTILEAMSSGLPIVAGRFGGTPELVTHGENGILLDHVTAAGLLAGMQHLLSQPQLLHSFGCQNRNKILSQFSLLAMKDGYEQLFSKVVE